jgi:hypothetical protein
MLDRELFEQMGQEIVGALAERMRSRGLMLADFPRLTGEGHKRRMRAVITGRGKGRANLTSTIKRFVRRQYPDFAFRASVDDNHSFEKKLSPEFKVILTFERIHHFGLGKAFVIQLGCEYVASENRFRWMHSLLRFFDRESLEWTYGLPDELDACLEEASKLLDLILPEYSAAWLSLCQEGASEILNAMPHRGSLSFQEAADIAYSLVSLAFPEFRWVDGAWFGRERPYAQLGFGPHGDSAAAAGRLAPGHHWSIRFADIRTNRTVTVYVPFSGRAGFVLSDRMLINRNNVHHILTAQPSPKETLMLPALASTQPAKAPDSPMWREFADSPNVMEVAASSGGREFLRAYQNCLVLLQLNAEVSDPPLSLEQWYVHYSARGIESRSNLAFNISARDLSIIRRQN